LRGKVKLQTDGQLKTGRDIVVAAMLGAEEFGFATSALIVLGCVMMRKCHLNTCPVGIATQNTDLRKRFTGHHEQLVNYFRFLAEDVREELASMGYRSLDEIVGRSDLLLRKSYDNSPKTDKIDISRIIYYPEEAKTNSIRHNEKQQHKIDDILDRQLIKEALPSIEFKHPVGIKKVIKNTDRATGAMLSGMIAAQYGELGLPEHTVSAYFDGSAGQSFGAFLVQGVTFYLHGDTNDYLGKGLSGGRIIVTPPKGSNFTPEENIICGNTSLYGATTGEVFINGVAGERFAVRNSGAIAVIEGAGDHCCEYMTGGIVVVLGATGRNFAAGMSGGIAYVLDEKNNFDYFCNMEMVELSLVEDISDTIELKGLISNHIQYTNSGLAKKILNNWEQYVVKFKKVVPIEYKKVLQEKKIAELDLKIAVVERDY
jgi:glutamate synthase (NADPH/NADH) large chain